MKNEGVLKFSGGTVRDVSCDKIRVIAKLEKMSMESALTFVIRRLPDELVEELIIHELGGVITRMTASWVDIEIHVWRDTQGATITLTTSKHFEDELDELAERMFTRMEKSYKKEKVYRVVVEC